MRKTFTMAGATSDIGREVVQRLENMGHNVRKVSRASGISIDNEKALREAFSGSEGAYLVIPFDMQAPDLHKREDEIGKKLAEAVKSAGVKRVVFLSALSAHLNKTSGLKTSAWGAGMMEDRLDKLDIEELIHLRCAFFMENFIRGMNFNQQAPSGFFGSSFRGDVAMPMIACQDIADKVVELLTTKNFPPNRVRELHGARDYTMTDATRILGSAIGNPQVKYKQVPVAEAHQAMIAAGVSPSFADAVMETANSFNNQDAWALEKRSPENTTKTTLEQWAQEVLRKTFQETTLSELKKGGKTT